MSTNIGLKLFFMTDTMSEIQVKEGTIISFFLLLGFKAANAATDRKLAEEPELTKTLYFTPNHLDHSFSNFITFLF